MKKANSSPLNLIALLLIVALCVVYYIDLPIVPFHPDESTQIFMSADVDRLSTNPAALLYDPSQPVDLVTHYHLLDAPLTRYAIGIARQIAGVDAQPADWDWSKTWEENNQNGALPDEKTLLIARLAVSCLYPLMLGMFFETAKKLTSPAGGIIAVLLMGTNALVLMHTRRAMAESFLLLLVVAGLYFMICAPKKPFLQGWMAGLALCAKQSSAPLLLVGVCAQLFVQQNLKKRMISIGIIFVTTALIFFALNPFLWSHPVKALQDSLAARSILVELQVRTIGAVSPDRILNNYPDRLISAIANIYFLPPATADVGNYLNNTLAAEQNYFSHSWNNLFRSIPGGVVFLILTLLGWIFSLLAIFRNPDLEQKTANFIVAAGSLFFLLFFLATIPLPFQRYIMPILPFTLLCQVTAIITAGKFLPKRNKKGEA